MKVTTKNYLMLDAYGNKSSVTVEEGSDRACFGNLKNLDGTAVYFEDKAYHITSFCETYGIQLKVIDRVEDFDIL